MRYILIISLVVLFSGCISTKIPPKSEFRINPNTKVKTYTNDGCKDKSLKVTQAFSSNSLLSQNMYYGLGNTKQYIYSKSLWSTTPNRAITKEFVTLIRGSKLFKSVQSSKSRSKNDFILEINIEDFMQYFSEDSQNSFANVILNVTLINARTNLVIDTQTFSKKVEVKSLNASGGVDGLNTALSDALYKTNNWLARICK